MVYLCLWLHPLVWVIFLSFLGFHKTSINVTPFRIILVLYCPVLYKIFFTFKLKTGLYHYISLKFFGQSRYVIPTYHLKFVTSLLASVHIRTSIVIVFYNCCWFIGNPKTINNNSQVLFFQINW